MAVIFLFLQPLDTFNKPSFVLRSKTQFRTGCKFRFFYNYEYLFLNETLYSISNSSSYSEQACAILLIGIYFWSSYICNFLIICFLINYSRGIKNTVAVYSDFNTLKANVRLNSVITNIILTTNIVNTQIKHTFNSKEVTANFQSVVSPQS